jgi:hypothetical protein
VVNLVSVKGYQNNLATYYDIPTGSGEQIRSVGVGRASEIKVKFSERADGATPTNITNAITIRGISTANYVKDGYVSSTLTREISWGLHSVSHPNKFQWVDGGGKTHSGDAITITLDTTKLIKPTANTQLDGNFATNPSTLGATGTSTLPSGDGAAGNNLVLRFVILPGDFNRDNKVDLNDFGIIQANFGTGTTYAQGDADGDGDVDLSDFGIFQANNGINWTTFPY